MGMPTSVSFVVDGENAEKHTYPTITAAKRDDELLFFLLAFKNYPKKKKLKCRSRKTPNRIRSMCRREMRMEPMQHFDRNIYL